MAEITHPSTGLDRLTGGTIYDWEHVIQSVEVIFTTHFGERVMREWFGSFVPNILGENITPDDLVPFFSAIASAIDQWEPRLKVTGVDVLGSPEQIRQGRLDMDIKGHYRPRALYGDFTIDGPKVISIFAHHRALQVFERLAVGNT